jgi:hypothetical protein
LKSVFFVKLTDADALVAPPVPDVKRRRDARRTVLGLLAGFRFPCFGPTGTRLPRSSFRSSPEGTWNGLGFLPDLCGPAVECFSAR